MTPRLPHSRGKGGRGRGGEGDLSEQGFAFLLLTPAAVLILAVILAPLVITFAYTLIDMNLLSNSKGRFTGLADYGVVLGSSWFRASLGRTLYFTFVSLALEAGLGLLFALLLAKSFPGVECSCGPSSFCPGRFRPTSPARSGSGYSIPTMARSTRV